MTQNEAQMKIDKQVKLNIKNNNTEKKNIDLKVFVANIPKTWSDIQLKQYFEKYGQILDSQVIKKQGSSTGAGIIRFAQMRKGQTAISQLKKQYLPGVNLFYQSNQQLQIRWAQGESERLGIDQHLPAKLFVGSLPRGVKQSDIEYMFSTYGQIQELYLMKDKGCAFVIYKYKQSALMAIKQLDNKACMFDNNCAIQVRVADKRSTNYSHQKKTGALANTNMKVFYQVFKDNCLYFYNFVTKKSQNQRPPPGSIVYKKDKTFYIQPETKCSNLNDLSHANTKNPGPPGANLFIFHLPNNMKDSQLYDLFKDFGNVLSARVMTKDGKSKGFGFVSYDKPASANEAVEHMNGHQIFGKRLKVQVKKGDQALNLNQTPLSLKSYYINPL